MILAVLDDLMFTSKIKTAASLLGVPIAFARSSEGALADMRRSPPSLVILDLNSTRVDPLGTIGSMKADPALAAIPTVGFASHVQADVIEAARKAGVGEVGREMNGRRGGSHYARAASHTRMATAASISAAISHPAADCRRRRAAVSVGGSLGPLRTSRIAATDRSSAASVAADS